MHWLSLLFVFLVDEGHQLGISFDNDILPILTKSGCNAGACHGAAAGRGDFHLSLFGADPASDYEAIVHAFEGRRVNLARPKKSLLLAKPMGELSHGGDVVIKEGSQAESRLTEWIQSGAQRGTIRKLKRVVVSPTSLLCESIPAKVPLRVCAVLEDGTEEDVTHWTSFASTDVSAVTVDEQSIATVSRSGQHVVIARYQDRVIPISIQAPFSKKTLDTFTEKPDAMIDNEVLRVLTTLRIPLSPAASDSVWLRRVTLDLTGRLPEPEAVTNFLNDTSSDKRIRCVDSLLWSEAYVDYWTFRFAKLLRLHSLPNERAGLNAYSGWLRDQVRQDEGWDKIAKQLLTATGDSHRVGPANFGRMVSDARGHAELVGQVFLGMQLGCANCHNHPLDRWTQDDYHGLAAVFAKLDRSQHVKWLARGAVTNLRTGEPAIPRIPGVKFLAENEDPLSEIFEWVKRDEQNYLARAAVNRLWQSMFGRGLVEPVNDLRETNPATHPQLLSQLANDFATHGYRIRHTLRQIALSETYSRSSHGVEGNEQDDRFYSRYYRRPLEPEVLVDAIAEVTGVPGEWGSEKAFKAIHMIDASASVPTLEALGKCKGLMTCGEGQNRPISLTAELHLLNGDVINQRIIDPSGRVRRMIESNATLDQVIEEFFLRALSCPPTKEQRAAWKTRLLSHSSQERQQKLEDFVWSLLNSPSFRETY